MWQAVIDPALVGIFVLSKEYCVNYMRSNFLRLIKLLLMPGHGAEPRRGGISLGGNNN